MVHLVTGYAGYAHIKSADDGAFNASFFGAGQYVMEFGNQFEGSIIDNSTVRILDGDGLMYGRHFRIEPNTYEDLNIATGTAGTSRIDLICMTYEKKPNDETEKVVLQVIKGTETAGTPSVPEYTDGNILEGASLNQMPLYKVKIEGVVLSDIEPVFKTIPSYEGLAKKYADRFEAVCEELKSQFSLESVLKKSDVINNVTSTDTDKPLSANQGKVLKGLVDDHGNHVPATQTASNKIFLRNDNTWQTVTPANIGALPSANVANNLTSTASGYALDARQGKALNDKIVANNGKLIKYGLYMTDWALNKAYTNVKNKLSATSANSSYYTMTTGSDSYVSVKEAGLYLISISGSFKGNSETTGGIVYIRFTIDGNTTTDLSQQTSVYHYGIESSRINLCTVKYLTAGQKIRMEASAINNNFTSKGEEVMMIYKLA